MVYTSKVLFIEMKYMHSGFLRLWISRQDGPFKVPKTFLVTDGVLKSKMQNRFSSNLQLEPATANKITVVAYNQSHRTPSRQEREKFMSEFYFVAELALKKAHFAIIDHNSYRDGASRDQT